MPSNQESSSYATPKTNKPFFFRIDVAALMDFATDPDGENVTLLQFAKALQKGHSDIPYIQNLINEARSYIEGKREAGKKGGIAKSSSAKAVLEQCQSSALANSSGPLASNRNNNSNRNNIEKDYSAAFEEFWGIYPRKTGKREAWEVWQRLKPPLESVLSALAWQVKSDQWTRDGGKYIPSPTTYLNQGRWEDEPVSPGGARHDQFRPAQIVSKSGRPMVF